MMEENISYKYITTSKIKGNQYYRVQRRKNKILYDYKQLEDALKCRAWLIEHNWDKENLPYELTPQGANNNTKARKFLRISENITMDIKKQYYRVNKWIDGKTVSFYNGYDYKEAVRVRDYYKKHGWVKPKPKRPKDMKYITKCNGKYRIQKIIKDKDGNRKLKVFNYFNDLDSAKKERDLLVKYNWDYDTLIESEGT